MDYAIGLAIFLAADATLALVVVWLLFDVNPLKWLVPKAVFEWVAARVRK